MKPTRRRVDRRKIGNCCAARPAHKDITTLLKDRCPRGLPPDMPDAKNLFATASAQRCRPCRTPDIKVPYAIRVLGALECSPTRHRS